MPGMRELSLTVLHSLVRRGLRPGMRLPTELEMTREFGVSRPTLRQALKVLEFAGLIASAPRRGTILQQPDAGALAPLLAVQISLAMPAASSTPAGGARAALAEARWLIERSVAPLAVRRREPADLMALQTAIDQFAAAVECFNEHARLAADRAFHRAFLTAAHNPVFDTLGGLIDGFFMELVRERPPVPDNIAAWIQTCRQTQRDHERILAALTAGDANEAVRWIDLHLEQGRRAAGRLVAPAPVKSPGRNLSVNKSRNNQRKKR